MRADVVPGTTFPDYKLPDENGTLRRLSELQRDDPMAVMLARGGYCPKEHRQHMWMAAMHPEIEVGYCRLVTISTDSILASNEWKHRLGAHWPFLSDESRIIQRDLDIAEYTDAEHNPMIPHTIFLEPGLRIFSIYSGYWYWGRPTPEELRLTFRAISKTCRPDWDLADPSVLDRWHRHDQKFFFPYKEHS